jgi:hypothetical protein
MALLSSTWAGKLPARIVTILLCVSYPAVSQTTRPATPSPIQDNSFLIEEAYNQEDGVVQHISTFSRMWNSKDWSYTFTQEWPAPHNWRHQFSYTLMRMHAGDFAGSGAGWGDTALHYRYQLLGNGDARVAFAPRVSILMPTGNVAGGRGAGGVGIQVNLPFSVALHPRIVTHWNAGTTFVPQARSADGYVASTLGYNLGNSIVYLLHSRFNALIEASYSRYQSLGGSGRPAWSSDICLSPGVRWAHNFSSGLQVVPGVAVPMGIFSSAGERGIFLYLSFEHPFQKQTARMTP